MGYKTVCLREDTPPRQSRHDKPLRSGAFFFPQEFPPFAIFYPFSPRRSQRASATTHIAQGEEGPL